MRTAKVGDRAAIVTFCKQGISTVKLGYTVSEIQDEKTFVRGEDGNDFGTSFSPGGRSTKPQYFDSKLVLVED